MSRTEFTPEKVFAPLAPNEIFVFGSNLAGHHGGGAARAACKYFGAVWGRGTGLQGNSYAIPTMQGGVETIRPYVDEFILFAKAYPQLRFLVTPVGCGVAGFRPAEIAPLFREALDLENVILPRPFVEILSGASTVTETRDERKARLVNVFRDTLSMIDESDTLKASVEWSRALTRFYAECDFPAVHKQLGKRARISVTNHRTFEAAGLLTAQNPGKRIAVLNFASATTPGGGVKGGSGAQEESLCRCSTLYPVLSQKELFSKYYEFHRYRNDPQRLYSDACIYSPDIQVIKSDGNTPERLPENQWFKADVITCAAPNFRNATPLPDTELYNLHLKRGRKILDVALAGGAECLVLGAFGCGAFRNNPEIVARAYAALMEEYREAFDTVEFAVFYFGNEVTNFNAFQKALGSLAD